jgi:tetratricopeptide (TPR) repeat protein
MAQGAGYLPRSWAKLEIERLLAEDAGKHREHIVELSKAMYVMTPFTSLLVLENEQMYRENKVDRGRKDHWAIYDCPEMIKVVYEPDENSPTGARQPEDQKPTAQQVLQTILVRVPPRCISWPNSPNGPNGPVQMALHFYGDATPGTDSRLGMRTKTGRPDIDAFAPPDRDEDLKDGVMGLDSDIRLGYGKNAIEQSIRIPDAPAGVPLDLPPLMKAPRLSKIPYLNRPFGRTDRGKRSGGERGSGTSLWLENRVELDDKLADPEPLARVRMMDASVRAFSFSPDGESRLLAHQPSGSQTLWDLDGAVTARPRGNESFFANGTNVPGEHFLINDLRGRDVARDMYSWAEEGRASDQSPNGRWVLETVTKTPTSGKAKKRFVRLPDYIDHLLNGGGQPRLYSRPSFSGDQRIFSDLASYAPGMNTSTADINAVLEAEAMPRLANLPGHVDAQARTLIERARSGGWQKLTFTNKDGKPVFSLIYDGAGRYAYERTLPSKLVERVVCDGRTLLHLYPDLHIGARRTVSRFHRADFAAVVPWLVPPVEDLAHGADVTALDDHTVAVSPKDAATTRDESGKPIDYVRLVMIFGEDGRLMERTIVLMPKDKVLARETYDADGTIKLFIGDKKEPATSKRTVSDATAPDLKPDVTTFAVLPLPLRSRETVYRNLGFNWNQPLNADENACYAYLNEDDALELFATNYAAQNSRDAGLVYRNCLAQDMARAAGFHVLLASCGDIVFDSQELRDLRAKQPRDPLLVYLSLLDRPEYLRWQPYLGLDTASGLCEQHPFFGPLTGFRDQLMIWQRWKGVDATKPGSGWLRERQQRGLEFVRKHSGTAFGWALLGMMFDSTNGSDHRLHREWADACALFVDHPAFGYSARYERAHSLLYAEQRDEARALFREMFEQAIKAGVLPAVDASFREALQGEPKEADLWTDMMRQTAATFCKDHRRPAAVALAWECWQLGDQPLASNLLTAALDGITDEGERTLTTLSAVAFLYQTAQHSAADAQLRPLLDNEKLAQQPALWRMAGRIADARGLTARSIECLERALALEYDDLPEIINLEEIRRDYGRLLDHYASLARAVTAMKINPPRDLLAKTVRAADCWRALDREQSGRPCDTAATILRSLGATDLAWEYQTTPLGQRPNESGPWLGLAQSLQREGDFRLADRAYTAAFEAEPTNAQILWDRAQSLRQNGRQAEAQKVLRQIVEGDWQPRFDWVRSQARWQLEGH